MATDDKRVIFNADDFGLTRRVNEAVIDAHRDGLLTSASVMITAPFAAEAIALARDFPALEIGLHLVLCQGRPALPPAEIPGLVRRRDGAFAENPVLAGLRLFFAPWLRAQVGREVAAQIERFRALAGRPPAHLDGHLNIHVHPTVLPIAIDLARAAGVEAIRLPREPAGLVLSLDPRARAATRLNGFIFERLSARAERRFRAAGIRHAGRCFGVLRPFAMTEAFLEGLLERLEPGLTEIYAHPGHPAHGERDPERAALLSPRLCRRLRDLGIAPTAYGREGARAAPDRAAGPRPAARSGKKLDSGRPAV